MTLSLRCVYRREVNAAHYVLALRDDLEVPWVAARPVPAQVIELHAGGDWAAQKLKHHAMKAPLLASVAH
jgi:hypothetical protein